MYVCMYAITVTNICSERIGTREGNLVPCAAGF